MDEALKGSKPKFIDARSNMWRHVQNRNYDLGFEQNIRLSRHSMENDITIKEDESTLKSSIDEVRSNIC